MAFGFGLTFLIAAAIIFLFKAFFLWLWRLFVSFFIVAYQFLYAFYYSPTKWSLLLLIATLLFGVGLFAQELQEESMTIVDIVWECGITRITQPVMSFLSSVFRAPVDFLIAQWNEIVLFVLDAFNQLLDDIGVLIQLGKVAGLGEVYESLQAAIGFTWADIVAAFSVIMAAIKDAFIALGITIDCYVDALIEIGTSTLITRTIVNQGCTMCVMDPPLNGGTELSCTLREPFYNSPEPDCDNCTNFMAQFFACFAHFLDFIMNAITFGNLDATDLVRIFRAIACVIGSMLKPFLFIFTGLLDWLIFDKCVEPSLSSGSDLIVSIQKWFLSEECGKSSCIPPKLGGSDLPIGIIPCFEELIRAITGDEIEDFFLLIFGFLFDFIAAIVGSITGIVDCVADDALLDCLQNYPLGDPIGSAGPGVCNYAGDTGFDKYVPDDGLHKCFRVLSDCMDDPDQIPLLQPIYSIGVLPFLLDEFWQFSVDLAVCPFATSVICFEDFNSSCVDYIDPFNFMEAPRCILKCIEDDVPPFSVLAKIMGDGIDLFFESAVSDAIDWALGLYNLGVAIFQQIVSRMQCVFKCDTFGEFLSLSISVGPLEVSVASPFLNCIRGYTGGLGGPDFCTKKKDLNGPQYDIPENATEIVKAEWKEFLLNQSIFNNTICGNALHSGFPHELNVTHWGNYITYWGCLVGLTSAHEMKTRCGPEDVDIGGLLTAATFPDAFYSLRACVDKEADIVKNNETLRKELMKRGSETFMTGMETLKSKLSAWDVYNNVLVPLGERIRSSNFYAITADFIEEWNGIKSGYKDIYKNRFDFDSNSSIVLKSAQDLIVLQRIKDEEERDLKHLYTMYANAFIWNYRGFGSANSQEYQLKLVDPGHDGAITAYGSEVLGINKRYDVVPYDPASGIKDLKFYTFEDFMNVKKRATELFERANSTTNFVVDHSDTIAEILNILNRRYNFEYWPWVQRTGAFITAAKTGNIRDFWLWVNGSKSYLVNKGFVENEYFENEMKKRDIVNKGGFLDVASGQYDVRAPRRYRPFPFPVEYDSPGIPWSSRGIEVYREMHAEQRFKRDKRKQAGFGKVIGRKANVIFDANLWFYNYVDDIFEMLGGSRWLEDLVQSILDFYEGIDIQSDILEELIDFIVAFFNCDIPENINGSTIYSPFCVFLVPEDTLGLIVPAPNKVMPLQVGWPDQLVERNCTNVYNGNNDFFEFEISDNCEIDDNPQLRPLCPICDYCSRGYRSCRIATCLLPNGTRVNADELCDILGGTQENGQCKLPNDDVIDVDEQCERLNGEFQVGLGDFLDSILYILAILPRFFTELIIGGIDMKLIELIYHLVLFVVLFMIFLLFPIWAFLFGILHIVTWILFMFVGPVMPWWLIVAVFLLLLIRFLPGLVKFLEVPIALAILFIIIGSAFRIAAIFVDIPPLETVVNIIEWLTLFFEWFRDLKLIAFFRYWCAKFGFSCFDFEGLLLRLDNFNYGAGPIPDLHTFCFFWNFANFGLMLIVLFLANYWIRLLLRWLWVTAIFFVDLILILFFIRRGVIIWATRRDVDVLQELSGKSSDSIGRLERKFLKLRASLNQRISDRVEVVVESVMESTENNDNADDNQVEHRNPHHVVMSDAPDYNNLVAPDIEPESPPNPLLQFPLNKKKKKKKPSQKTE